MVRRGLTEARRVVAMAAADDVLVVPHGSSVYAYHLQYAFPNCPVAEFINLSPPVWKSKFYGAFTPSTRRLLDGVAVPAHHPLTHWLISTQVAAGDAIVPYFGGCSDAASGERPHRPPDRTGGGVTLDRAGLTRECPRTPADVAANYRANQNAGAAAAEVHMLF